MSNQPTPTKIGPIHFEDVEIEHLRELQREIARAQDAAQGFVNFLSKKYKPDPNAQWQLGEKGFEPVVPPPANGDEGSQQS